MPSKRISCVFKLLKPDGGTILKEKRVFDPRVSNLPTVTQHTLLHSGVTRWVRWDGTEERLRNMQFCPNLTTQNVGDLYNIS